ncbi:hypothetical protein L218DRAFT_947294 [Marasmius fiardii PR-910]|nr:hypothetical protein L218DRAFT_947294 [Marasmius fiardii PR-910]
MALPHGGQLEWLWQPQFSQDFDSMFLAEEVESEVESEEEDDENALSVQEAMEEPPPQQADRLATGKSFNSTKITPPPSTPLLPTILLSKEPLHSPELASHSNTDSTSSAPERSSGQHPGKTWQQLFACQDQKNAERKGGKVDVQQWCHCERDAFTKLQEGEKPCLKKPGKGTSATFWHWEQRASSHIHHLLIREEEFGELDEIDNDEEFDGCNKSGQDCPSQVPKEGQVEVGEFLCNTKKGDGVENAMKDWDKRYWYNNLQQTNGKLAHQIHIFSTFFYKKLLRQRRQPSKKIKLCHQNIMHWTKGNIFAKKYLLILEWMKNSLGHKHPKAVGFLVEHLRQEAIKKFGVKEESLINLIEKSVPHGNPTYPSPTFSVGGIMGHQ